MFCYQGNRDLIGEGRVRKKLSYAFFCYLAGLLLLFGTYLAWETRKVHIPALNDSKLIGMCVYNTVILFSVVLPVQAVLMTNPTASFALMAFLTIFCTSFTLCVVFFPKVTNDLAVKHNIRARLRQDSIYMNQFSGRIGVSRRTYEGENEM